MDPCGACEDICYYKIKHWPSIPQSVNCVYFAPTWKAARITFLWQTEKANNNKFSANIGYGKQRECADGVSTIVQIALLYWKYWERECGIMDDKHKNKKLCITLFYSKTENAFLSQILWANFWSSGIVLEMHLGWKKFDQVSIVHFPVHTFTLPSFFRGE